MGDIILLDDKLRHDVAFIVVRNENASISKEVDRALLRASDRRPTNVFYKTVPCEPDAADREIVKRAHFIHHYSLSSSMSLNAAKGFVLTNDGTLTRICSEHFLPAISVMKLGKDEGLLKQDKAQLRAEAVMLSVLGQTMDIDSLNAAWAKRRPSPTFSIEYIQRALGIE